MLMEDFRYAFTALYDVDRAVYVWITLKRSSMSC